MFSSSIIAASGVSTGYSADFIVGTFSDKFGTRRGFVADPNSTPAWQQQGSDASTINKFGGLSPVYINIGSDTYQVVGFSIFSSALTLTIERPSGTASLAFDSITSISTDLGTLNTADITQFNNSSSYGNPNFSVSTWTWGTTQNYIPTNIIGSTETTRPLTIAVE